MSFESTDEAAIARGFEMANVRRSYDAVAADYAATFADELASKPLDRRLLADLAAWAGAGAVVLDLGCGPGQVGEQLAADGAAPIGVDLSPGMLAITRQRRAAAGDLRALPLRPGSAAAAVAFYCLHHLPAADLVPALIEVHAVLRPGGRLLAATHLGEGALHANVWFGHDVELSGARYPAEHFLGAFEAADFRVVERHEREPGPEEAPNRRLYVVAESRP